MTPDMSQRFRVVGRSNFSWVSGYKVLQDTETGVLYFHAWEGNAGGLSVMVDKDGKPVTMPTGWQG